MFGSISNWDGDLFDRFNRLQRDMEDFWHPAGRPASIRAVARGSHPAINIGTTAEAVEVFVFAAGLDKDQLDLSLQENLLTISGQCKSIEPPGSNTYLRERHGGAFRRSIALPEDINPDSVSATYRNGVLHISLQRKAEAKPRKIQINT